MSESRFTGYTLRMALLQVLFLLASFSKTEADYMMGGHKMNKEEEAIPIMEHRSDDDESRTGSIASRTANLEAFDHDFDLELDLLADQRTPADPARGSQPSSGSSSFEDGTAIAEETEAAAPRYRVLPYAFNGGHPFSLEKDPITGQIDFEKAPPLKALEYNVKVGSQSEETSTTIDELVEINNQETSLGPNEINPYSPSFHDFLNLPIRYTYEKYENSDKYPLVSSSYANTKVQSGANSYNTYNHKKYHEAVKPGVDIKTLYVQPSRKTYYQTSTKSSTSQRPIETTSRKYETTTSPRTTTTERIITSSTTTTEAPAPSTQSKHPETRFPEVTTWKPQEITSETKVYGIYDDYEATLPIERLQQNVNDEQTTTVKSRYASPPQRAKPEEKRPSSLDKHEEYDDNYDVDYDRILQIASKPEKSDQESNDSQDDYSYGSMDFLGGSRPEESIIVSTSSSTSSTTATSLVLPHETSITTQKSTTTISTSKDSTILDRENEERRDDRTTTSKPFTLEEKRVTSMPIDTIMNKDNYRTTSTNYANNLPIIGSIDNSISGVNGNNVLYHNNRPSGDNYYPRPPMGMSSGDIVVKSTSNVVVPPGQDTVSFVLGNRQSVGSVSDAASEYYGMHPPAMNERPGLSFGTIVNSRPSGSGDNYSGQMIVSAGIGVGSNSHGSYDQRPSTSSNNFDHAVVTVGMPTVDIVNTGESGTTANANKHPDASTNSLETLAQKWWASTSASANSQHSNSQASQDTTNQEFGYRVVFPEDKAQAPGSTEGENPPVTQRPLEEHVIVVHEAEIGHGNTLRLDPSSQSSTSQSPGYYHYETTSATRLPGNGEEKVLPELSENLTPPAERPNILPSGIQRPPSYNYYHHHHRHHPPPQSHSPSSSRPTDYRDQRLPQRLPSQSSSTANGFKRRPASSPIDTNLPNILPQFRPNAKTSHGHNRGETIGTIPAGVAPPVYANTRIRRPPSHLHHQHSNHQRPPTSRRPVVAPSHLQRLNPPPLPPPPPPISSLRLPTPAPLIASPNLASMNHQQNDYPSQSSDNLVRLGGQNHLHKVNLGVPPASFSIDERHRPTNANHGQQIKSRLEDDTLERFSAEPPSRPPYFTKRTTAVEQLSDGMPRIATLQMIQQHGGRDDEAIGPNLPPPYRLNGEKNSSNRQDEPNEEKVPLMDGESSESADRRGDDNLGNSEDSMSVNDATRGDYVDSADSPVYVVYPVKGALDIRPASNDDADQDDASVVLGTYGSQRPLPPDTLLQDTENSESGTNENSYRPGSSLIKVSPSYAENSRPQLASDFPYPLERPDPSMFTSQLREKPLLVPNDQEKNPPHTLELEADREITKEPNGSTEDPRDDEFIRDVDRDASVNVIPYLQDHVPFSLKENAGVISATLHRLASNPTLVGASSTPIAYVYTPTTRAPVRRHEDPHSQTGVFSRRPVLLPSQQPSSSSSSAPSPQSFMAPFVASASAEAPTKNGWSVVMMGESSNDDQTNNDRGATTSHENEDKEGSKIDRNAANDNMDVEDGQARIKNETRSSDTTKHEDTDLQTEKNEFDVENFTPQLFGGFRPILKFPESETDEIGDGVVRDNSRSVVEKPRSEIV